ncbi:MAG: DNA cytosine methyltransferase [Chromatiales bacterium]|nr:DNA cytosine methyltransferase [Chromatiales bacterium]
MRPNCMDLFAGCGGLSLGLHAAGFQCVLAIEAHADAFETYRTNLIDTGLVGDGWPEWLDIGPCDVVRLAQDHRQQLVGLRGEVDLVAGGPPCQGFTMNGRRDPDDPRSRMVSAYLDVVEHVRPRLVLLENVPGFVSMKAAGGDTYAEVVRRRLGELGYEVWADVLMASDWGVPQRRPRYICVAATRGSLPGIHPFERLRTERRGFLGARGLWPGPTTVRDALSDFELDGREPEPDPEWGSHGFTAVERHSGTGASAYQRLMRHGSAGQPNDRRLARHSPAIVARLHQILATCRKGASLRPADRERLGMGKRCVTPLDPQSTAPTVTTLPDDFVHYSEPRTMSVREHARLQSFPDWFSFCGPYTAGSIRRKYACPRYTQVGNAVPPLLAEAIGESLLGLLADQECPQLARVA